MIKEIYVDMDGVLCDFFGRYNDLFGSEPERDYPSNTKRKKVYKENWRKFVDGDNFATLEPLKDFKEGLKYLNKLQKDGLDIFILSSTAAEEFLTEISRQKFEWLQNHDVKFHPIFVPGKALKRHYAGKNKVLIDDTLANVEQWDEDGGIGILHKNWSDTIGQLNKILNEE